MKIIDVVPISKGIGVESLSYFTALDVSPGCIVKVPLRSKKISALVIAVHDAQTMKSELKSATFSLKKIDGSIARSFLSEEWLSAAGHAADFFATTTGAILHALIPKEILEKNPAPSKKDEIKKTPSSTTVTPAKKKEILAIQGDDEERISAYKSLIRQEFARKSSIFVCCPTIEDARRTHMQLEKGVEGYAFLLHSALPKKKLVDTWVTAQSSTHPVVIVSTGQFLCLHRPDFSTIILEKEHSRSYKIPMRPFLDIRTFVELYSNARGAQLIIGDILLRTETLWRVREGDIAQASPFKFRSLSTAEDRLVDMRAYKGLKGGFKILSEEVEATIKTNKEQSEHMFILATRRGLSPSVVCGDCQNIVTCKSCSAAVVLHKSSSSEKNFFMCHRCGERRSADETCSVCGSWKLATIGIGIDLVEEKIIDKFPGTKIFKIDSDSIKSEKAALETVHRFKESPGSILLGTEMALVYLDEKIEHSAVISLDSLFSIPDFRIYEKILYTLIKIRALTTRSFIVQTRNPKELVFDFALKGNLADFYRTHLEERKDFKYPPFYTLIKLSLEGERTQISEDMAAIQTLLEPFEVEVFPAFTHTIKGKFILHGLIRIPHSEWISKDLLEKLRSLPPTVQIKVDPDSLL